MIHLDALLGIGLSVFLVVFLWHAAISDILKRRKGRSGLEGTGGKP